MAKSRLEDIVETLKKLLLSDWNDVNFVIGTNPNDQLEIKFDLQTVVSIRSSGTSDPPEQVLALRKVVLFRKTSRLEFAYNVTKKT